MTALQIVKSGLQRAVLNIAYIKFMKCKTNLEASIRHYNKDRKKGLELNCSSVGTRLVFTHDYEYRVKKGLPSTKNASKPLPAIFVAPIDVDPLTVMLLPSTREAVKL